MKYIIKVVLAVLLFGCLLHMPYGYYQFIRWACCAGFIYLIKEENERDKKSLFPIGCIIGLIVFNPIIPLHFSRLAWNIIDAIVGGLLLVWIIVEAAFAKIKKPL